MSENTLKTMMFDNNVNECIFGPRLEINKTELSEEQNSISDKETGIQEEQNGKDPEPWYAVVAGMAVATASSALISMICKGNLVPSNGGWKQRLIIAVGSYGISAVVSAKVQDVVTDEVTTLSNFVKGFRKGWKKAKNHDR